MKKNKDDGTCPGGVEHPLRDGMKCWGNHDLKTEGHWAYITERGQLRRISWRTEN